MSPHQFDHCHCDGRSAHPKHDGPFADPTVETILTFGPMMQNLMLSGVPLVKRQDRHEDGSVSTTYYLELTEDQYRRLGGE